MQGSRGQSPAALVSQRLCDLFLQFPTAAIGGVRWKVLAKRYEDRHGKLDLAGLGHSSNIAAASALLWDVLRFGSTEDPENPVLHVEDAATLTPQPNLSGTWPSLYASLRTAVLSSGSLDEAMGTRGLLLSQLKPLLQSHWHASFDEYGMGFFNEEGAFVKLRKMKHLVQQVLAWRSQRVAWRQARGCEFTAVDEALRGDMELVASKSHNDLVLRCPEEKMDEVAPDTEEVEELAPTTLESTPAGKADLEDMLSTCSTATPREVERQEGLERELAELRAENAALRRSNESLLRERDLREVPRLPVPMLEMDLFDDPFEPPPQRPRCWATPSTMTPGSPSASMTPISAFDLHSGAMTPVATGDGVCALVPMWFSWLPAAAAALGDRSDIPTGIVEKLRNQFESTGDPKPLQPPQAWRL